MPRPPRPLFVTRRFPPSVGGMETLAAQVWADLSERFPGAVLVANRRRGRAVARWAPGAVARTAWAGARRRVDVVVAGDAVTGVLLSPVLRLTGVPAIVMCLGLDVRWPHRVYQRLLRSSLLRAAVVLTISDATTQAVRDRAGLPPGRVVLVPLGVDPPAAAPLRCDARRELVARLGLAGDARIIATLGRLVRRKGVRWLVEEVFPALPGDVVYLVAGDGPDRAAIEDAAARTGTAARVRLLGEVDDATRELLLRGPDLFVQPNLAVPGDMEGFGLVTVEAAVRGLPALVSSLEGLRDAVQDGRTGYLIPPGDAVGWVDRITELLADPGRLAAAGRRFAAEAGERYHRRHQAEVLQAAVEAAAASGRTATAGRR